MTLPKDLEAEAAAVMAEQEIDIYRARFIVALRHELATGDVVDLDENGHAALPVKQPAA